MHRHLNFTAMVVCQIELNSLSIPLIYMVLWFTLPLIAAFFLFKHLPSSADVSGPFKGFTLKFTGAFGGYFILFFMFYLAFGDSFKKSNESSEVWTITGDIASYDNAFDLQRDKPSIIPLDQQFQKRKFEVRVIGRPNANGLVEFPMLTFTSLNYQSEDLPYITFNKFKKNISGDYEFEDYESRRIKLKHPLKLTGRPTESTFETASVLSVDTSLNLR